MLSHNQKIQILIVLLCTLFLGALDQTIVSAAAPKIVNDLYGIDRFTWLSTAYLLSSTALVPIYGRLADVYARKKIAMLAVSIFIIGSVLCGVAGWVDLSIFYIDKMMQLMIARFVQGMGGAGLFTMAFVIIADLFPPAERGKYQGYTGAVFAAASILGPTIGGYLSDFGNNFIPGISGWRYIFFLNLPLGSLILFFLYVMLPQQKAKSENNKVDWKAAFLLITSISSFLLVIEGFKTACLSLVMVFLALYAIIAIVLFVKRSLKSPQTILNLNLFQNGIFRSAAISLFFTGGAFVGILLFEPLYQVKVLHQSSTQAGMSLIFFSLGIVCTSVISGKMVSKYGYYKRWILGGLLLLLFVLSYFIINNNEIGKYERIALLLVCGFGFGPTMPLYSLAVQNAVSPSQIGQATAACQFFRQMGGVILSAILGNCLSLYMKNTMIPNQTTAYADAIQIVHVIIVVALLIGVITTLFLKEIPLRK